MSSGFLLILKNDFGFFIVGDSIDPYYFVAGFSKVDFKVLGIIFEISNFLDHRFLEF